MRTFNTLLTVSVVSLSVLASTAYAAGPATATVTNTVGFAAPLSITNVVGANFGKLTAGSISTYKIDTTGAVTTTTGTGVKEFGTATAASLKIVGGAATQAISISAGTYTASSGVTPSAATCKYGAGTEVACTTLTSVAAPGVSPGTALLMGLTVAADGTQLDNSSASPSFVITVAYN